MKDEPKMGWIKSVDAKIPTSGSLEITGTPAAMMLSDELSRLRAAARGAQKKLSVAAANFGMVGMSADFELNQAHAAFVQRHVDDALALLNAALPPTIEDALKEKP